ncbi:TIGR03086 family metal-binding protein [Haloactinopolyspora sp.]|uniref:TIGR03086 family metal-binding protein n=1 Tax=Haloactinopolyspora sp. TaxID=1966353 RepID=UPI0026119306|nr:TIGR03086 family metal-binding protein [Haloactinopolyspora sp.]
MNEQISHRYAKLAADFAGRVAAVAPERWSSPSPCDGWTARDVVQHVIDSHVTFLELVGRSLPQDAPSVDDDAAGAFGTARAAVQAGLDDPAIAAAEYDGVMGTTTFAQGVDAFLCFDLAVHGWDLARAAGLPDRIDPDEVRRVHADAVAFGDALRGPGWFGPEVQAPEHADEQAQLLAFLGRRPE